MQYALSFLEEAVQWLGRVASYPLLCEDDSISIPDNSGQAM